jgi:hypothetical protein
MTTNGNLILFKLWGEQNMKTMIVALGMLVLLGGQLASASVDRSTEVKKSATSTTAAVGAPIHVAGRMVTSGG